MKQWFNPGDSVQHKPFAGTIPLQLHTKCLSKDTSYTLREPPAIQIDSASLKNITCFRGTDGTIRVNSISVVF